MIAMQLPNLLIIGAMKAGTTSFYMDLTDHPGVYRAEDKEPHALCSDEVLTPAGKQSYAAHYATATASQITIDASTAYAKRPDFEGVAERAVETLGSDFKIIYIVRHPLKRIISQHHHEFTAGTVGRDINQEVRQHPRFLAYSRYAYQLEPWIQAVGTERILVLPFEEYVQQREKSLANVCEFLGIDAQLFPKSEASAYNKTSGKPVRNRFWDIVFHSGVYRQFVRRILSPQLRLTLMKWFLPKGSLQPEDPTPETLDWLKNQLTEDVLQLQAVLGLDEPLWEDLLSGDRETPNVAVTT